MQNHELTVTTYTFRRRVYTTARCECGVKVADIYGKATAHHPEAAEGHQRHLEQVRKTEGTGDADAYKSLKFRLSQLMAFDERDARDDAEIVSQVADLISTADRYQSERNAARRRNDRLNQNAARINKLIAEAFEPAHAIKNGSTPPNSDAPLVRKLVDRIYELAQQSDGVNEDCQVPGGCSCGPLDHQDMD